jgi:hypothetical protein
VAAFTSVASLLAEKGGKGMTEIFTSDDEHLTDEEIRALPRRAFAQDPVNVLRAIFGPCRPDAIVPFGSRRALPGGNHAPHALGFVTVGELLTNDGAKLSRLLNYQPGETQFFCPNPIQLTSKWIKKRWLPQTGGEPSYFPVKRHCVAQVRCLIVDLDVGRAETEHEGMSGETAIAALLVARDSWGLPLPSLVASSGRGAYALWLLHPLDILSPPDVDPNAKAWEQAERQLIERLKNLSVDPGAKCIVHWFKRPGTVDTLKVEGLETKSGNVVTWFSLVPNLADVPVYDLHDIVERTKPEPKPGAPRVRVTRKADGSVTYTPIFETTPTWAPTYSAAKGDPHPSRGAQPAIRRVRELKQLNEVRGGIREGMRNPFLYLLAVAVSEIVCRRREGLAAAETEAMREAFEENAKLRPPLRPKEVEAIVRALIAQRRKGAMPRTSNDRAVRDLKVTLEEVASLGLVSLAPNTVRSARAYAKAKRRMARLESQQAWRAEAARLHAERMPKPDPRPPLDPPRPPCS